MQTTTIEAVRQVDILTKVSGQVVKLPVEEGVRVKKGDLLVELNEAELQIEDRQAGTFPGRKKSGEAVNLERKAAPRKPPASDCGETCLSVPSP